MILISIKPEPSKNIFNGIKAIEWRTKPLPRGRAAVYETLGKKKKYYSADLTSLDDCKRAYYDYEGCGKVIGEFEVIGVIQCDTVDDIPESFITVGCVSRKFLRAYSKGKPLYANYIENVKLYDTPKELEEFRVKREKAYYAIPYDVTTYHKVWIYEPLTRPPQSWINVEEDK